MARRGLRRPSERARTPLLDLSGATPIDLLVRRFAVGTTEMAVFAFPGETPPVGWQLTGAEQEVLRGVLAGQSNAEIAAARRTSPRTVGNQVAAIFRKLGVNSRGELAARWAPSTKLG